MAEPGRYIARKALEEAARMAGLLGAIYGAFWLFGRPAAIEFVATVVEGKHFAADRDVTIIERRLEDGESETRGIKKQVQNLGSDLEVLKATSKANQELLTEQRQDIKSILRNLNEGGGR
jgi:hypothetical protein